MASRPGRRRAHFHGDPRHLDRQRGASVHRRRAVGLGQRQRLGHHQLPRRQRDDLTHHRVALGLPGSSEILPDLDRRIHRRLGALRHGHEPRATDLLPGDPGPRRGRTPAVEPGRADRHLPAGETERRHDGVCHRRAARAGGRPDPGRLYHGLLRVALDLLHQHPGGDCGLRGLLPHPGGSGLPQGAACDVPEQALPFRLHRAGPARLGRRLLGGPPEQGPGVGLV